MENKMTVCACASRSFIDKNRVAEAVAMFRMRKYEVDVIPDLCGKVMRKEEDLKDIAGGIVVACHLRAVRSHFDGLGLPVNRLLNLRENSPEEMLRLLEGRKAEMVPSSGEERIRKTVRDKIRQFPVENGTDAWYPVIDKERCTECGKCHDFCLFGVYVIEKKKVRVAHPQNCKNNCPACARMCPNRAIIFPKYEKSPINGGMAVEETFHPEEMERMYRERLRMRLQQRRADVSLLKP
jgi:NAD-dependent dihydropyrimidine dehydrogenase PreA subunit